MGKLKRNLLLNITYQVLILFLPLVTSAYLSRVIGAKGIGRYSYSYSIALYFTYFTLLGLNRYGNRVIASVQENLKERSENFWEIYMTQICCFVACVTAYLFYAVFLADDRRLALIQVIFVASSLFDINWFFLGMEMFDKIVFRNFIVKLLTAAAILLLIKVPGDVEKYAVIMSTGYLISQVILFFYLKEYIVFVQVKLQDIKKHILPNFMMFLPVIAVSIYKIMDKIMLGLMSTKESVGYYENAEKIINVPLTVVVALGTVMFPRVTALISADKDWEVRKFRDSTMTAVTAFSAGAMFGLIAVARLLSLCLYGEGFEISGDVIQYLAVTLIFLSGGDVIRTQFLIPYKYDRVYIQSAFLGAIVNLVINSLLIPQYAAIGAAIGTICAEAAVFYYQIFMVRAFLPLLQYTKDALLFCSIGVLMLLLIRCLPEMESSVLTLILQIVIGGVFYSGIALPVVFKKTGLCSGRI